MLWSARKNSKNKEALLICVMKHMIDLQRVSLMLYVEIWPDEVSGKPKMVGSRARSTSSRFCFYETLGGIVLANRTLRCHLDPQTLKNYLLGHPSNFVA